MNPLVVKFAAMVDTGDIEEGKELPRQFTFDELQYLFVNGFIYDDGSTFIVAATEGFE